MAGWKHFDRKRGPAEPAIRSNFQGRFVGFLADIGSGSASGHQIPFTKLAVR